MQNPMSSWLFQDSASTLSLQRSAFTGFRMAAGPEQRRRSAVGADRLLRRCRAPAVPVDAAVRCAYGYPAERANNQCIRSPWVAVVLGAV